MITLGFKHFLIQICCTTAQNSKATLGLFTLVCSIRMKVILCSEQLQAKVSVLAAKKPRMFNIGVNRSLVLSGFIYTVLPESPRGQIIV